MTKAFYSLVKVMPNQAAGDSLTIGIILRQGNAFLYRFSAKKTAFARSLFTDNVRQIDMAEKQITRKLEELNSEFATNLPSLYSTLDKFTDQYFSYLNKYSNGILHFSAPSFIADSIDESKFEKLYRLFVDDTIEVNDNSLQRQEKVFRGRIEKKLIKRVEAKVHTHVRFDNTVFPALVSQFELDCVGLNGSLIGAKALPLFASKETISKQVNGYMNVILHLSYRFHNRIADNKFYLIADEPSVISSPEHKVWESLQKETLIKVISSEQAGIVADKIEETGASTFLDNNISLSA